MSSNPDTDVSQDDIDEARRDVVEVVGRYLPLKKAGKDHVAPCPFHSEKSPSFSVTGSKGFYHCFGCGKHGDAIDFVMDYTGVSFREAVEAIIGNLTPAAGNAPIRAPRKPQEEPEWRPIKAAPAAAEPPNFQHYRLGAPAKVWTYRHGDGSVAGFVARYEYTREDGRPKKETVPTCWAVNTKTGEMKWRGLAFGAPRTLYNADKLVARPKAPVLVVEGEKPVDAAELLFTGFVVVTWPGGSGAVDYADWQLLAGRNVTLWPDWDWKVYPEGHENAGQLIPEAQQIGVKAMRGIYAHLKQVAAEIRFVRPMPGSPDGWDLADPAPAEGWTALGWAKENVVQAADYFEPRQDEVAEDPEQAPAPANDNRRPARRQQPQVPERIEFGMPLDVFGIQPPPEMPMTVLPPSLVAYVRDQAALTGCDPGIIGLGALVAAAACITDGIRLQPKRYDPTWTESARIWAAFVGDPSTKKSPAIGKAVRHIKRLEVGFGQENEAAMADYKWQLESWKEAKKADKSSPAPEPKMPAKKRVLIEDTTVEALSEVLKDNPRGVLNLRDELAGWFAAMDAYKGGSGKGGASKDRADFLELFNGGPRSIDRVGRGNVNVPNWSGCVLGGIQPDMIRRVAADMGHDGLLQRFLVYCARPAIDDVDRVPDMDAMRAFGELFDHLISLQDSATAVTLEEGAQRSRAKVIGYSRRLIAAIDAPPVQAWLGKWEGLYARLLLLYHVIECAGMRVHPSTVQVTAETADQVECLMLGVLLPHAIHFYTEILDANDRQDHIRQLARMILSKRMEKLTKRDITTHWKASRRLGWWEARQIVDALCTLGWLEPDNLAVDTDGKPRAWYVNPAIHEIFVHQADRETARRRDAAEALRELRDTYMNAAT